MRFWLKFESDFVLTFLIDAEVPELKLMYIFSQLHHKDQTIAKTSRGVKTHSMNQDRSQFGSSEHAKSVAETWCDKTSKHRKNCGCFVSETWSEKLLTKTTKRTSGIESAKTVISGSQNYEMVFLLQKESISSWWSYVSEDTGHRFGIFRWYSLKFVLIWCVFNAISTLLLLFWFEI